MINMLTLLRVFQTANRHTAWKILVTAGSGRSKNTVMKNNAILMLDNSGTVKDASKEAIHLCDIPGDKLIGHQLIDHAINEHRIRLRCELEAIVDGAERHGRVHCTLVGADGIGRRLTLLMNHISSELTEVRLSPHDLSRGNLKPGSRLLSSERLLPVARRISGLARHTTNKLDLLRGGLDIVMEVTSASSGAALEWGTRHDHPPSVSIGSFKDFYLKSVFRHAILARLSRGDVVLVDTVAEAGSPNTSLLLVPLLSSATPIGIFALAIDNYSVLVPEEQQSLIILGEILGLGIKALEANTSRERGSMPRKGDREATIALGRLSSGLTHGISNSVTVLRNYLEHFSPRTDAYSHNMLGDSAMKDSLAAIDNISDLADALKAFAPEETSLLEEVDLLRVLDMVTRSVRFYGKRGLNLKLERPRDVLPLVKVHSHHLIRSLFLIFVELVEASQDSGIELTVGLSITHEDSLVTLTITVTAGPFSLPAVLLAQIEKGGALARHVSKAGGDLTYSVDHQGNLSMSIIMPEASSQPRQTPVIASSKPPRRGTILIADEEAAVIRSLRRVLESEHDILAARNGEEALNILKATPHLDIVIYDSSMPRCTGPEFYKELKRLNNPMTDRIIFVSGGATEKEISDFLVETDNPVLDKPFNLLVLHDLISSMLV